MTTNARSGILLDGGSSIATTHAYGSIDLTTTAETFSDLTTFRERYNIPTIPRLINTLLGKARPIEEVVYLIISYAAGPRDNTKLARMVIACVFYLPLIILGPCLSRSYCQSRKLIFRTVEASSELQRMCQIVFIFFDTLTFDFQLAVTMVTLILVPGHIGVEHILLLSLGVILCIGWLILGCYSMRYEHKNCAIFFLVSSFVEVGYVIYKLVKTRSDMRDNSGVAGFVGLAEGILACGACALLVRVFVLIFAILAVRNFKNGLKEKAFGIGVSRSGSVEINA